MFLNKFIEIFKRQPDTKEKAVIAELNKKYGRELENLKLETHVFEDYYCDMYLQIYQERFHFEHHEGEYKKHR